MAHTKASIPTAPSPPLENFSAENYKDRSLFTIPPANPLLSATTKAISFPGGGSSIQTEKF